MHKSALSVDRWGVHLATEKRLRLKQSDYGNFCKITAFDSRDGLAFLV